SNPAFSPEGELIAYVGYPERDDLPENTKQFRPTGDLWVVSSAGGAPVKLASVDGLLGGPVWSPDGRFIAAQGPRWPRARDDDEIWVYTLSPDASSAGEPTRIVLPRRSTALAGWTPQDELGVFIESERLFAIFTVPASGGKAVQVTPDGIPYYPRWSPDGERVLLRWVRLDEDPPVRMAYVPAEGGDVVEIPWPGRPFMSRVPGGGHNVSPDGKSIVVSASREPYRTGGEWPDVWTIPLDGGPPTRLTNDESQEGYPCWSPDGKWVAFAGWHEESEGDGFGAIYMVPAEGGETRRISSASDGVGPGAIAFSPDGERIAFFSNGTITTIPVEGGHAEVLVAEVKSGWHSQLAYSPDGSRIAHNAGGKIWITALDGGATEELRTGLPEGANLSEFGWSPNGAKIVFMALIGGDAEFWLISDF
ncbi:MAG: PD40 domain-containing protein, partial [Gemmatimonadetes bacterium]|nr:PD40 domain-containing protein [Gemmatimonadota bacterium]